MAQSIPGFWFRVNALGFGTAFVVLFQALLLPQMFGFAAATTLPATISFKVTYRDFNPASCFFVNGNQTNIDIFRNAWDTFGDSEAAAFDDTGCNAFFQTSTWRDAINSGIIRGHPDFQANPQYKNFVRCANTFPIGSCIPLYPHDVSILNRSLVINHAGIPKPEYCSSGEDSRCGRMYQNGDGYTQTRKKYFDSWYNDDIVYNRRVGQLLELKLEGSKYAFDSETDNDMSEFGTDLNIGFFGPLDRFKEDGGDDEITEANSDPLTAIAWPQANAEGAFGVNGQGNPGPTQKGFWLTTELHATFEYRTDAAMLFEFSGDDDFWAFIDGQMVIDLGGLHSPLNASIDLNGNIVPDSGGQTVAQFLGLQDKEVYTLDVFHAERQSTQSNFKVETTLFESCNVQQSGTEVFDISTLSTQNDFDDIFSKTSEVTFDTVESKLQLSKLDETFKSHFVYTTTEENIGRGFVSKFKVTITEPTDGFAFVVHRQSLNDYPISGAPNFNIKNLKRSFAVVFDLCRSQDVDCVGQRVSLHYPDDPAETNTPKDRTLRVYDNIALPLATGTPFEVEIIYYGGRPNFLEVFIGNSLYLRQDNFDVTGIIGGLGGRVGLTATTSAASADLTIEDWTLRTVEVDPELTQILNLTEAPEVIADGETVAEGVLIKTFDGCGNPLDSGTLGSLVNGFYVEKKNDSGYYTNGNLPVVVPIVVIDKEDGTYSAGLKTDIVADFELFMTFGEGCNYTYTIPADLGSPVDVIVSLEEDVADTCPDFAVPDAGSSIPVPDDPNGPDGKFTEPPGLSPALVGTAAGAGSFLALCAMIAVFFIVRYRQKWLREKKFIAEGKKAILENSTELNTADEFSQTTNRVMETSAAILRYQAQAQTDPKTAEIMRLRRENDEIREQNRMKTKQVTANKTATPKPKRNKKLRPREVDF